MTRFVSFLAIAALALSVSSAEAAKKKPHVAAARSAPVQTSARAKWLSQTRKCGVVATSSGMIDALINAGGFDNGRGSAPITSSSLGYRKLPHETSYSCGGITAPL